jgi:hypothetical protein
VALLEMTLRVSFRFAGRSSASIRVVDSLEVRSGSLS